MTTKKKTSPNSRATTPHSIAGKGAGGLGRFRKQSRNANKHTERGLDLLDKSIRKNGWIGAMTAAADGEIFDGSARLDTVTEALPADPIIVETDGKRPIIIKRTDIKKATDPKAVRLALEANRIAQVDLNWDVDVLGEIAAKQKEIIEDLFGDNELKKMGVELGEPEEAPEAQMDKADELLKRWKVKTGDLWQIGEHRILCGDCTKAEDVDRVMGKDKADMVFADPPYGVDYEYTDDFQDSPKDYEQLADGFWEALPNAPLKMLTVGHKWNNFWFEKSPSGFLVWFDKTKQSPSNIAHLCKSELILIYGKVYNRFPWDTLEIQQPRNDGLRELHTCPKPLELWETIIRVQEKAKIIFDPFSGSGTTLVACERLGRKGRAIEIAPKYVAVALQRLSDMGLKPKLLK